MFKKKLKPSSTEDFITTNTKNTVLSACNSVLKQCFYSFFNLLITKSTNHLIDKLANRQLAFFSNRWSFLMCFATASVILSICQFN